MSTKIVITSGYFNPLHLGHIQYLRQAKVLGDALIVIINNDEQVKIKGSRIFMNQDDRMSIIGALKVVDRVVLSIDKDESVCKTIEYIKNSFKYGPHEFIFAKGGDRFAREIPEAIVCNELDIKIVDGLGAKIRASSEILKEYETKNP